MSISYGDLMQVDLGRLGTAVSDWKKVVGNLEQLETDARDGLKKKSDRARWEGVNAGVTRKFVDKTVKEFADLHTEANSIFQVLEDAHRELVSLQKGVRTLTAEAKEKGYTVQDNGDGTVSVGLRHDADAKKSKDGKDDTKADRQHYADSITRKIAHAHDIDVSAKLALKRAHGNDLYNAGHAKYGSLNDAQVERALELAKKREGMSDRDLAELNRLLRHNGREKDGEFATEFFEGLGGPRQTLEFYAALSIDGTGQDASTSRLAGVQDLQRYMGHALANATDPYTPQSLRGDRQHLPSWWGAEFRELGTQEIEWERGQRAKPYGYQVLGGLLRYGNYDPAFLTPIAEHVTQLHQDEPKRFLSHGHASSDDRHGFNPSGKLGSGNDPLISVLEALGHSPEAAEQFFTDKPTAYNEDGTIKSGAKTDFTSYLDLFADKDFEWAIDRNATHVGFDPEATDKARTYGPDALGHALEAAATGRVYDSDVVDPSVKHSKAQAELVHDIVEKFSKNPDLLTHNMNGDLEDEETGPLYALRDSLGNIAADYMGDFQQTMYQEPADSKALPVNGAPAKLGYGDAQKFLGLVGQDPDAYNAITAAQQAYTTAVVHQFLDAERKALTGEYGPLVGDLVAPGAAIAGIMSNARADAIYDYHTASNAEYNEAVEDKAKWVGRFLGLGTGAIPPPFSVATEPVNWLVEDVTESVVKSVEEDTTDEAELAAGAEYSDGRKASAEASSRAVRSFFAQHEEIDQETMYAIDRAVRTAAGLSHSDGAQWNSSGDGT
ncbi:hypothetical protein ROS62_24960 [Streptomyces sp. DSM 41972]|uniref:Uncharacterized protein n=1 Tax=Streptomyces althioticus subsp. attaecolombicae TaxID=3075534 RepID=A0ABU3I4R8_9ACTN|nr:hypothetical protein [Streptomyces sp. DSM 41972]SCD47135.1 hypothetical protein GA0115245_106515 [Streptomyces sp. di188]SCD52255.1 hypothetical protein GA0115238_113016 [Streptomyces sp. di50b]